MAEHDNPMGTKGFEFVAYAPRSDFNFETLFKGFGFADPVQHQKKNIQLYQQNNVNFIVCNEANCFASEFAKKHGPSAFAMGFRVEDARKAYDRAISLGATAVDDDLFGLPAIEGIGGATLYLVDDEGAKHYQSAFGSPIAPKVENGLLEIDHLTHNLFTGNLEEWSKYYETYFNFREIRYFDIQGKQTGLISKAMTSPCNNIRIPLNESKDTKSQIAEYLQEYNGEGIQHIALSTNNIFKTVESMRTKGINFLNTPDTYYQLLNKRLPGHGENVAAMQKDKILIDGGEAQGGGLLLQIFTETVIGPIFFEIIQRKGNEGFGEGNFQALFDSIELEQIQRGVLKED